MPRDAKRAAETGFYRYLTKPVKVDELTRVLEELLGPKPAETS
jgi:CheY-like chemotaxis protein